MQDHMQNENGIWETAGRIMQKEAALAPEVCPLCKTAMQLLQREKCRMNCRIGFLQFMRDC